MYNLLERPGKGVKNALILGQDGLTGWQREILRAGVPEWIFTGGGCHIYAVELAKHFHLGSIAVLTGIPASRFSSQPAVGFHAFLLIQGRLLDVEGIKPLRPYVETVIARKWEGYEDFRIVRSSAEELLTPSATRIGEIKNKWGHWVNPEFVKHATTIACEHISKEWNERALELPCAIQVELSEEQIPQIRIRRSN